MHLVKLVSGQRVLFKVLGRGSDLLLLIYEVYGALLTAEFRHRSFKSLVIMHLFHYVGHVIGSFILFLKLILGKIYPFFVFKEVGSKHSIDFFEIL